MENRSSAINIPGAIIIAGALIAVAVIYVNKPASSPLVANVANSASATGPAVNLEPVTSDDHILGNPNAPLKIVEYSDPSCPFCKTFNTTMVDIMNSYGPGGKVAWVYRSYPLDTPDADGNVLHPNAGHESQAMECAAKLGGNDTFWKYEKILYETTPSVTGATPKGLDQNLLSGLARSVGLDQSAFDACLSSGQTKNQVTADFTSGVNAGVTGTPTSFFILDNSINPTAVDYVERALLQYKVSSDIISVSPDKRFVTVSGAMPKAFITGLIESLLNH
ncbi:MAG: thioredoxin domain-containing protein [Candidatus Paceibacterota bacterium]